MKTLVLSTLLFFLIFNCTKQLKAQDPVYSIYWNDRVQLNPARTGEDQGLYLATQYRKQWPGIISAFNTFSISADIFEPNIGGGLGVRLARNEEGEGYQKTDEFMLNYSAKIPIDLPILKWRAEFAAGIGAGIISRIIDPSKLVFSDQLDPVNGVIYSTNANIGGIEKAKAANFNIGLSLRSYFTKYKTRSDTYWNIGFSVINANEPNLSLVNQEARLPLRYVAYVEAVANTRSNATNSPFFIKPAFLYVKQQGVTGRAFESFRVGATLSTKSIVTAIFYKNESFYDLRKSESLIYVIGVTFINTTPIWRLFYSYDMTISELASHTKGVHEIGINCLFEGRRLFKRTNGPGRRLQKSCPKFGFMPEWM